MLIITNKIRLGTFNFTKNKFSAERLNPKTILVDEALRTFKNI
jgi:hypothetical protein